MFKRIDDGDGRKPVTLHFEDRAVEARAGDSLAVALLQEGCLPFRTTPVSGAPRAPLCLMGVCFECLLEVDGRSNVQGCMVEVRDGMRVRRQEGARLAKGGQR